MSASKKTLGLSALLLGFSVGSLSESRPPLLSEEGIPYLPSLSHEGIHEGAVLDLSGVDVSSCVWDAEETPSEREGALVYRPLQEEGEMEMSYAEAMSALFGSIDLSDGWTDS